MNGASQHQPNQGYAAGQQKNLLLNAIIEMVCNKKPAIKAGFLLLFGGPERIRTAVRAFAELCLATRPQDQLPLRGCKCTVTFATFHHLYMLF